MVSDSKSFLTNASLFGRNCWRYASKSTDDVRKGTKNGSTDSSAGKDKKGIKCLSKAGGTGIAEVLEWRSLTCVILMYVTRL